MAVASSSRKDPNALPKRERQALIVEAEVVALKRELAGYEAPGRERPDRAEQVRAEIARRQRDLRGRDKPPEVETTTRRAPETTTKPRPRKRS